MRSPWPMLDEEKKIADFTDALAREINSHISKDLGAEVATYALDKNSGFIINLNCYDKHSMEIMVARSRSEEGKLTLHRFWGVSSGGNSSPKELRNAAQVYEEMTAYLDKRFGEPISEHDGRSMYQTTLEGNLETLTNQPKL